MRAEPIRDPASDLRDYRVTPPPESSRLASWIAIVVAFLLGFFCGHAHAAEPYVRLQVRPRVMIQRNDIDVQTRVCRDETHRTLRITWDSDRGWAGSSETALAGAAAPIAYQFWLEHYPAANYDFEATTLNHDGRVVHRDRARILAPEAP